MPYYNQYIPPSTIFLKNSTGFPTIDFWGLIILYWTVCVTTLLLVTTLVPDRLWPWEKHDNLKLKNKQDNALLEIMTKFTVS